MLSLVITPLLYGVKLQFLICEGVASDCYDKLKKCFCPRMAFTTMLLQALEMTISIILSARDAVFQLTSGG